MNPCQYSPGSIAQYWANSNNRICAVKRGYCMQAITAAHNKPRILHDAADETGTEGSDKKCCC